MLFLTNNIRTSVFQKNRCHSKITSIFYENRCADIISKKQHQFFEKLVLCLTNNIDFHKKN